MTDLKLCAVCGSGLSIVEQDGERTFGHINKQDHPAVPVAPGEVPARPMCDFCSNPTTPEAVWTYVTEPFETTNGELTFDHSEPWAACEECHELIRKGDIDGLTVVSAQEFINKHPIAIAQIPMVIEQMQPLHQAFYEHIAGEPYQGLPAEYVYKETQHE